MKELWYRAPAETFTEALPVGSGRLGAMVYGQTQKEKISLNEDTLWSGYPKAENARGTYEGVQEAENLVREGKIKEAEKTIWRKCLSGWSAAYQPAGNLWIDFSHVGEVSHYRRSLDLEHAVVFTEFQSNGFSYRREVFCSYPDQVLAIRCFSNNPSASAEVSLELSHPYHLCDNKDTLLYQAIAPVYSAPSYFECEKPVVYDPFYENRALSYAVAVKPILFGGSFEMQKGRLIIHSSNFLLLVTVNTNFERFDKFPQNSNVDPEALCLSQAEHAAGLFYEELRERHIRDYSELFSRVSLSLCGEDRDWLPTDERLRAYSDNPSDNGLPVLVFDYGRYLMIACSRPGTQAANLQGIWNEEMRAPWSSNYTLNINTQMNYWPAEACGLPECHEPLFAFIEELAQNGAETAKRLYHCRGWCSHHNSDLWRLSEPVGGDNPTEDSTGWAYWSMSGAWLVRHLWQHYEYTQDAVFLKNHWETIKGAALFLLDRLQEKDGKWITSASTSPENRYILNGNVCCLSENCAIDIAITIDLFTICRKAAVILHEDGEWIHQIDQRLSHLKAFTVGSEGQLLEWDREYDETDIHHRHISPLYGLYPGESITADTPSLYQAAEQLMRRRGNEATGWGIAWKINVWARLQNGKEAKECLEKAMRPVAVKEFNYAEGGGLYSNLLDAHPPFQIDGNFGITAGICEMLLQNTASGIKLIPALPPDWHSGSVKGLRAKEGKTVDFSWKDGKITEYTIR